MVMVVEVVVMVVVVEVEVIWCRFVVELVVVVVWL